MADRLYEVPDRIKGLCKQKVYSRWQHSKAESHARRDQKRFRRSCRISEYKKAIHKAVTEGGDRDCYTREILDWSLISTYRNETSNEGKAKYKKSLALLPIVDHTPLL